MHHRRAGDLRRPHDVRQRLVQAARTDGEALLLDGRVAVAVDPQAGGELRLPAAEVLVLHQRVQPRCLVPAVLRDVTLRGGDRPRQRRPGLRPAARGDLAHGAGVCPPRRAPCRGGATVGFAPQPPPPTPAEHSFSCPPHLPCVAPPRGRPPACCCPSWRWWWSCSPLLGSAVGLFVDLLWFRSVGFESVFTGVLSTRVLLFVLFGTLVATFVGANLVVAYRLRPPFTPMSAEQQNLERYRTVLEPRLLGALLAVTAALGLFVGLAASAGWEIWLTWRNGTQFGQVDAQFGRDISYFAFTYPFQRYVLGFAFGAVVLAGLASVGAHYLFGGLRLQSPGDKLTRGARGHLAVLVGLFVLLKAFAYYLDRFGLAFQPAGDGDGAVLHRRHRGPAGQDLPRRRRGRLRAAVLRRRLPRRLARPGARARRADAVRGRGGRRRPGAGPADPRQPQRDRARGALHRAQHQRDPRGVRDRRRRGREQPRQRHRGGGRGRHRAGGRRAAGGPRPAAGPGPAVPDLPAAPAAAHLLRVLRPARRGTATTSATGCRTTSSPPAAWTWAGCRRGAAGSRST